MTVDLHFVENVRRYLVAADFEGISFRILYQRTRTKRHTSKDLVDLLSAWKKRRWVDEYYRRTRKNQHEHIFRATQLMLDEWPQIKEAMAALVMDSTLQLGLPSEPDASQSRNDLPVPSSPEPVAP